MEGRYRLGPVVGRGRQGLVYEATDIGRGTRVAVKILHEDVARTPEQTGRMLAEARTVAETGHPNVVRVLDAGDHDGRPCIVMERVQGVSLAARLLERRLSVAETLRVADQLLRGLTAAHGKNVVHRDLTPGNILVGTDAEGELAVKITDFGLAPAVQVPPDSGWTQEGPTVGTPGYMAPEQARGEPVDPRTDVYAVGVLMHTMLSGAPPYAESTAVATLTRVIAGDREALSRSCPGLPLSVVQVVNRAMSVDPAVRYPDANTMRRALARVEIATHPEGAMARTESQSVRITLSERPEAGDGSASSPSPAAGHALSPSLVRDVAGTRRRPVILLAATALLLVVLILVVVAW